MINTKKKARKQIDELQNDFEIVNPIESKTILGGEWYDGPTFDGGSLSSAYAYGHSSGGYNPGNFTYDGSGGSYANDWNNYDGSNGNYGGGGGGDNTADGILETPSFTEIVWLLNNTNSDQRERMKYNVTISSQYGRGQGDGVYDALRHAMWSAMDAADIGLVKAREFHTLHETVNPGKDNPMDLHNNNWGYNWYSQNGNPDHNMQKFLNDFEKAVANGQIQTHQ